MTSIRRIVSILLASIIGPLTCVQAIADPARPLAELFSTADGKSQFIQLADVTPSQLAGMVMTSSHDGIVQTFVFPATSQLTPFPGINNLLIVSRSLSQRPIFDADPGAAEWDYVMPDNFLPLTGGTLSLGTIDRWEYGDIPGDGFSALYRSGGVGVYGANSSAHGVVVLAGLAGMRFVNEYASDDFARHFFTAFKPEIGALNSKQIAGWHAIYGDYDGGTGFAGYGRRVAVMSHAVCRFYVPPPDDAHFFTASEDECAEVQSRFPRLVLETDNAFYAGLPDPKSGTCAPGLWPLYRLWNPMTNDHWYTADDQVRRVALSRGYLPEGYGDLGVGMCVIGTCFGDYC